MLHAVELKPNVMHKAQARDIRATAISACAYPGIHNLTHTHKPTESDCKTAWLNTGLALSVC